MGRFNDFIELTTTSNYSNPIAVFYHSIEYIEPLNTDDKWSIIHFKNGKELNVFIEYEDLLNTIVKDLVIPVRVNTNTKEDEY